MALIQLLKCERGRGAPPGAGGVLGEVMGESSDRGELT